MTPRALHTMTTTSAFACATANGWRNVVTRAHAGLILASLLIVASCAPAVDGDQTLRIAAASSLTDVFTAVAQRFEAQHAGVHVALTFAGSQTLRTQIEHGAQVDVFASADARHVDALRAQGRTGAAVPFAKGGLVLIAPRANPAGLKTFADLSNARRIVVGSAASPIGRYTQKALDDVGGPFATTVRAHIVSEEGNVRLVRAKVEMGEADAAIVYASDVPASSSLVRIPLPANVSAPVQYVVATVTGAPQPALAEAWVNAVLSADADALFTQYGFTR